MVSSGIGEPGKRAVRALLADAARTDAEIAAEIDADPMTVGRWRHRLEARGAVSPFPRQSRSRNPGAGERARAELLADPARGNQVIAVVARCEPQTVYKARRELERQGAIPAHACGGPRPSPGSLPSRTREAVRQLGTDATGRQVADLAGVSIQMAWKMLRSERAVQTARAETRRLAARPRCAQCGEPYEPHRLKGVAARFCSRRCQVASRGKVSRWTGRSPLDGRTFPAIPDLPPQPDLTTGRCVTAPRDQRDWWTSGSQWEREAARRICLACPVLDACRTWALTIPNDDPAVYAGMSQAERLAAKRAPAKALAS